MERRLSRPGAGPRSSSPAASLREPGPRWPGWPPRRLGADDVDRVDRRLDRERPGPRPRRRWPCSPGSAGWPAAWTAPAIVAFARHELAVWEFDVLVALRRTGPPYRLTPGQLLAETLVTSGTMTNRIDRLEARGLVVREPVPDDRRGTWVALTEAGRSRVDGAFIDLLAEERDLLAVLPPEDQADLATSLRHLLLQFESPTPPRSDPSLGRS